MKQEKVRDVLTFNVGDRVTDKKGNEYLFYGWTVSTIGTYAAHFVECLPEKPMKSHRVSIPWTYHAVYLETLEAQFPGITEKHRVG